MRLDSKHTEASFCQLQQICCTYKSLRYLDLKIWQFFVDDNDNDNNNDDNDTTDYFTLCVCVRGNYSSGCKCTRIPANAR